MWRTLRIVLLLVVFCAAAVSGEEDYSWPYGWRGSMVLAAIIFFFAMVWVPMVCLVEMFVARTAGDSRTWLTPSFSVGPFAPRNPLQFWFFSSFMFLSVGTGFLMHSLLFFGEAPTHLLVYFAVPLGLLLGCRLSLRLFRRRFEERKEVLIPNRSSAC